jgi:hypothetical protein
MSFLTPLYLFGAALIALPIVLHLLRRDVAPPVPFTAVSLLRKSPVDRSRRHRLRDLLLLAARVIALLLLAGSFARPFVAGAPSTGRTTIVAIDRSFSMAAPARFERARALAREAIDGARSGRVGVIAFDDRADVVAAPGTPADARAALDTIAPGYGATRFAAALDKAAEVLADAGGESRIVIVSDLQRSGFDEGGAVLPEGIDLQVRDAGAATTNLSVTNATIDRKQVVATVRNFGNVARTTDVHAVADGRTLTARRVTIPAGDGADVAFDTGSETGRLTVAIGDSDGYLADNERVAIAESRALPKILIVGGGPVQTAGFYFSRALQAEAEEGADFDVHTITGGAFTALTPSQVRDQSVIAILSTHGLDRRVGETLRAFLDGGGGLFVAAGQDMDPSVLSTLLGWQPPLAPRDARNAGVLAATDLRHPVLRPFDAVAANFGQVVFDRVWDIDAGSAWRVVARYTGGAPALAERIPDGPPRVTAGRVLLFTSDVDRRWNDFPLNPAFVPFSQEVVRYLGARPPAVSSYVVADAPPGVPGRPGIVTAGTRTVAINVDPRESTVDRVTPAEFLTLVTRSSAAGAPRAVRLAKQTEGQQNYWRYGLLLMLATLVVEAFVGSR